MGHEFIGQIGEWIKLIGSFVINLVTGTELCEWTPPCFMFGMACPCVG